jgi:hypothetical protein
MGMRDKVAIKDALRTPAGGLPILLLVLHAAGLLWTEASLQEAIDGLGSVNKFLAIPLLLSQYRHSPRGNLVLIGFLISCVLLMIASWALVLLPSLPWRGEGPLVGVPVKDYIAQSNLFTICFFGLVGTIIQTFEKIYRALTLALCLLAFLFLGNILYVGISRTALVVIPVLILALGWKWIRWKGLAIGIIMISLTSLISWQTSTILRQRLGLLFQDVYDYHPAGKATNSGERLEFWRKALISISNAPALGHGTGAIREEFRRSAVGQSGLAAEVTSNPHNQILAVGMQFGLIGVSILLAMWTAHFLLFQGPSWIAWVGSVVVAQNVISSMFNSHLYDFTQGWTYMWGVGVIGGMVLRFRDTNDQTASQPAR